jgi:putative solute:sodium symporter small subunit
VSTRCFLGARPGHYPDSPSSGARPGDAQHRASASGERLGALGAHPPPHGRAKMADLTEAQKQAYWQYNVRLTVVLLVIWFVVTYLISGLWAGWLNRYSILGFPLGYYMAAQGSLAIFVIEIAVYAHLMNKKDEEYGIREEA